MSITKLYAICILVPILFCPSVLANKNLDYVNKNTIERWGEHCVVTPNKKLGQCVQYTKCDYLRLVPDRLKFIKDNICGTASYTALVCCPLSSEDVSPPSTLPTDCINNAIENLMVGGDNATYDSSPWIALLSYDEVSASKKTYVCGGSLINDRYIVTAAHCLLPLDDGRQIASVHLGEWDFTYNNYAGNITPPIDIDVEKIISHPNYRSNNKFFDIGLIRMGRTIVYSDNMRPINLPFKYIGDGSKEGAYQISGFGQTETEPTSQIKKIGNIQSVPYGECREKYNAFGGEIQQIQICGTGNGTDTCFGDSGGSLDAIVFLPEPCLYLMGIVSYGASPCGTSHLPSVYTNILPFLEWISLNVEG